MKKIGYYLKYLRELFTGRCIFDTECEQYRSDSVICNSDAGIYCGRYRKFCKEM